MTLSQLHFRLELRRKHCSMLYGKKKVWHKRYVPGIFSEFLGEFTGQVAKVDFFFYLNLFLLLLLTYFGFSGPEISIIKNGVGKCNIQMEMDLKMANLCCFCVFIGLNLSLTVGQATKIKLPLLDKMSTLFHWILS